MKEKNIKNMFTFFNNNGILDIEKQRGEIMANVTSFMIGNATQAFPDESGAINQQLTGLVTVLRPQYIPSNYSFALAIGIRDIDLKEQNSLHLVIKSPSDKVAIDFGETILPIIDKPDTLPKAYGGFLLCTDVRNMSVTEEGVYHLDISINGRVISTEEIPIFKGA